MWKHALAFGICLTPAVASADQVIAPASKDAMIFARMNGTDLSEDSVGVNTGQGASGKGPAMFAGADGQSGKKRSLIQFDIATANIPAGSLITGVTMTLYAGQIAGSGGGSGGGGSYPSRTLRLFRLEQDWGEGNSGLPTNPSIGGTGEGYNRVPGDSTWKYASYDPNPANAVLWGDEGPGGNVASSQSGQATFVANQQGAFPTGAPYSWNSGNPNSLGMISDVQGWLDGTLPNYGWQLRSDLETSPTSFLGFWTRDGAAANGDPGSVAPALTITFIPEPAGLAILLGAGAAGLRTRRRTS